MRVLTGITPSGVPHLGNYVGAIRPCIEASHRPDVQSFFFLSDLHALIKCQDADRVERSRVMIAATWLACGLDPEHVVFYRQSDLPEIPELNWVLACSTSKGLMNRAHAYKAAVEANEAAGVDRDDGVTMGLFCYPVLMAADILMFNADKVPVGKDQHQHLEMARDIATRFNLTYCKPGKEIFVLPEAQTDERAATLPGLDGRKMSKSYDNVIPLFEGGAKALAEGVSRIVTDSRGPGEPKDPDSTALTTIYAAFATADEVADFRRRLLGGLAWGEAKKIVLARLESVIAPMRARYEELMRNPERIEEILMAGAAKARAVATPRMAQVREAVGLRRFKPAAAPKAAKAKAKGGKALFKQYREGDGWFYYKLVAADGKTLAVGGPFQGGREAGQQVARLRQGTAALLHDCGARRQEGVSDEEIDAALQAIRG